jgi:hypothetical protein
MSQPKTEGAVAIGSSAVLAHQPRPPFNLTKATLCLRLEKSNPNPAAAQFES